MANPEKLSYAAAIGPPRFGNTVERPVSASVQTGTSNQKSKKAWQGKSQQEPVVFAAKPTLDENIKFGNSEITRTASAPPASQMPIQHQMNAPMALGKNGNGMIPPQYPQGFYPNYYGQQAFYPPPQGFNPYQSAYPQSAYQPPKTNAAPIVFTPRKSTPIKIVNPISKEEIKLPVRNSGSPSLKSNEPVAVTPVKPASKGIVLKDPATGKPIEIKKPVLKTEESKPEPAKDKAAEPSASSVPVEKVETAAESVKVESQPAQEKNELAAKENGSEEKAKVYKPVRTALVTLPDNAKPHDSQNDSVDLESQVKSPLEAEEGEIPDEVLPINARPLTIKEINSLKYPADIIAPKLVSSFKYSSEFFRAFERFIEFKPSGLPDFKSIYGEDSSRGYSKGSVSMGRQNSDRGKKGSRNPRMTRQNSSARSRVDRGSKTEKRNQQNLHLPALVPGENAWQPKKQELTENEKTVKSAKGLLNKLTLDNFVKISDRLLDLELVNGEIVTGIVEMIAAKAITESKFCSMYAQLCTKMIIQLPEKQKWAGDPKNYKSNFFRSVLLGLCQKRFESDQKWAADDLAAQEARSEIRKNLDSLTAEQKLQIAQEDYERQQLKAKVLGNIRFVGELFLQNIIPESIIHKCLTTLISNITDPEEEDVEMLCQLMSSVGKALDTPGARQYMAHYFDRLNKLTKNEKLPSRIRFMVQDVIDLRKERWVPRISATVAAKSLAEVQKEIRESKKKPLTKSNTQTSKYDRNIRTGDVRNTRSTRDSKVKMERTGSKNEDGWSTPRTSDATKNPQAASVRSAWGRKDTTESRPETGSSNPFHALGNEVASPANDFSNENQPEEVKEAIPPAEALKTAIKEFKDSLSPMDLISDISQFQDPDLVKTMVMELIQFLLDKNGQNSLKIVTVFDKLFFDEDNTQDPQILIEGFKSFLVKFEEDSFDFPKAYINMASILVPLIEKKCLTIDQLADISTPLASYAGRNPAQPLFFKDILLSLETADDMMEFLVTNEVDFKLFFSPDATAETIDDWISKNQRFLPVKVIKRMCNIVRSVFEANDIELTLSNSFRWFNCDIDADLLSFKNFGKSLSFALVKDISSSFIFKGGQVVAEKTRELYIAIKDDVVDLKACFEFIEDSVDLLTGTDLYLSEKNLLELYLEDYFRIYYEQLEISEKSFDAYQEIGSKKAISTLSGWFKYIENQKNVEK